MENVNVKTKVELEFTINTSPSILFNRLSTPSGLSEWFADDVNLDGNVFTFIWDRSEHKAEMIGIKENKFIRFRWLDGDEPADENTYFEFMISPDELAGGVALYVTEFIMDDDTEDAVSLWNYQIAELKRNLGV
jgi:uncharacterized protein YndB with AHSA1/START domain